MGSFSRMATVAAKTKRAGLSAGGVRTAPVTHISSLMCTPLDPVDPDLRERLRLDSAHELLQTFVDGGLDIKEGDWLTLISGLEAIAAGTWMGVRTVPTYSRSTQTTVEPEYLIDPGAWIGVRTVPTYSLGVEMLGAADYPIRAVGDWRWNGTTYRHLILEDLKR